MRLAAVVFAVASLAAMPACSKGASDPPSDKGTVGADGLRHIAIDANEKGYSPATIHAKPSEKLVLTFTRTVDAECLSQVRIADGPLVDLPMNKPVDIPVTAPASGKLTFVCGMGMNTGSIVATD